MADQMNDPHPHVDLVILCLAIDKNLILASLISFPDIQFILQPIFWRSTFQTPVFQCLSFRRHWQLPMACRNIRMLPQPVMLWHYFEYSTSIQTHVCILTYLRTVGRASLAQVCVTSFQVCGLCDLSKLS